MKAENLPIYMPRWVHLERWILQAKSKVRKGYLNKILVIIAKKEKRVF